MAGFTGVPWGTYADNVVHEDREQRRAKHALVHAQPRGHTASVAPVAVHVYDGREGHVAAVPPLQLQLLLVPLQQLLLLWRAGGCPEGAQMPLFAGAFLGR